MYKAFFSMSEDPFGVTPNPKFFYLSQKHREALSSLSFGIDKRKGFVMVVGEIGTGKTTICRTLLNEHKNVNSALILNPKLSESELLSSIVEDFALKTGSSDKENLDILNGFLIESTKAGKNNVVILDESQNFSCEALEMVRLLSNLETEKEKLLQIVLIGQPELSQRLNTKELRQLNQRIVVRYHLQPLNRLETQEYIFHRLTIAGSSRKYLRFTKEAIDGIYKYTKGYPRVINILCDRALMAAYVKEKRLVNENMVSRSVKDIEGVAPSRKRFTFLSFFRKKR